MLVPLAKKVCTIGVLEDDQQGNEGAEITKEHGHCEEQTKIEK